MPLRVAICDDSPADLQEIAALVAQYGKTHDITIATFTSVEAFLALAIRKSYDVVLLDIIMAERDGYTVAKEMRLWETAPLVIFVTNSMEYTIRGYGVAFRYLPKPIQYQQIDEALDAATERVFSGRYTFSVNGIDHIVAIRDIYYFEVYGHWTTIHLADESFRVRTPLRSIRESLPQHLFGSPHSSYLVNFAHVRTASSARLSLTNGAVIPVSRRNYAAFNQLLRSFLGRV